MRKDSHDTIYVAAPGLREDGKDFLVRISSIWRTSDSVSCFYLHSARTGMPPRSLNTQWALPGSSLTSCLRTIHEANLPFVYLLLSQATEKLHISTLDRDLPQRQGLSRLVKGARLRVWFCRDTWVQIPSPALQSYHESSTYVHGGLHGFLRQPRARGIVLEFPEKPISLDSWKQ